MFVNAFDELEHDGCATVKELYESGLIAGKSENAIRTMLNRWNKAGKLDDIGLSYTKGVVKRTN